MVQQLQKTGWWSLKKFHKELSCRTAIPILSIYAKEGRPGAPPGICTFTLKAALLIAAERRKQCTYTLRDEQINKMWHTCVMEPCSALSRKDVCMSAVTCGNLGDIMVSEASHSLKTSYELTRDPESHRQEGDWCGFPGEAGKGWGGAFSWTQHSSWGRRTDTFRHGWMTVTQCDYLMSLNCTLENGSSGTFYEKPNIVIALSDCFRKTGRKKKCVPSLSNSKSLFVWALLCSFKVTDEASSGGGLGAGPLHPLTFPDFFLLVPSLQTSPLWHEFKLPNHRQLEHPVNSGTCSGWLCLQCHQRTVPWLVPEYRSIPPILNFTFWFVQ